MLQLKFKPHRRDHLGNPFLVFVTLSAEPVVSFPRTSICFKVSAPAASATAASLRWRGAASPAARIRASSSGLALPRRLCGTGAFTMVRVNSLKSLSATPTSPFNFSNISM